MFRPWELLTSLRIYFIVLGCCRCLCAGLWETGNEGFGDFVHRMIPVLKTDTARATLFRQAQHAIKAVRTALYCLFCILLFIFVQI